MMMMIVISVMPVILRLINVHIYYAYYYAYNYAHYYEMLVIMLVSMLLFVFMRTITHIMMQLCMHIAMVRHYLWLVANDYASDDAYDYANYCGRPLMGCVLSICRCLYLWCNMGKV